MDLNLDDPLPGDDLGLWFGLPPPVPDAPLAAAPVPARCKDCVVSLAKGSTPLGKPRKERRDPLPDTVTGCCVMCSGWCNGCYAVREKPRTTAQCARCIAKYSARRAKKRELEELAKKTMEKLDSIKRTKAQNSEERGADDVNAEAQLHALRKELQHYLDDDDDTEVAVAVRVPLVGPPPSAGGARYAPCFWCVHATQGPLVLRDLSGPNGKVFAQALVRGAGLCFIGGDSAGDDDDDETKDDDERADDVCLLNILGITTGGVWLVIKGSMSQACVVDAGLFAPDTLVRATWVPDGPEPVTLRAATGPMDNMLVGQLVRHQEGHVALSVRCTFPWMHILIA